MVVEDLDVVSRLVDHQQNLNPSSGPPHTALLALPTPPICRVLHAALFARLRAAVLEEQAIELGGGQGPVAVVDLDAEPRALQDVLNELQARGVGRLEGTPVIIECEAK